MKIYGDVRSGNCYKLKLICALLELPYEWINIDILKGETRSETFLALNPNAQIPICVTDAGEVLTESNSILYYLAQGSDYWPQSLILQTRVLEWQFFEQYSHEPAIAVARFIKLYQNMPEDRIQEYQQKLKAGYRVLSQMEQHLLSNRFLVNDQCSIADVSLFAYTHVADEGGFDLTNFPSISAWITRIQSLPTFVSMSG
jgi:glutathione S-transferase